MNDFSSYVAGGHDIDRDSVFLELTCRGQGDDANHKPSQPEFNPHDFGNEVNPTSFWGTVGHILIIAASPTLLSLPATFKDVGYVVGFVGAFCTVIAYAGCMHMLVSTEYTLCKRLKKPCLTYAELIYHAFCSGPSWIRGCAGFARQIVYADFMCIWTGGNAIYVLMAAENIKSVYDFMYNSNVDLCNVMACLTVPLVLLCWIPDLKLLVICSTFTNVVNACSIVIILYVALQEFPPLSSCVAFGDFTRIPLFLGTIFITITATGLMMPLKNQMRNPREFSARLGVLNVSYAPVCLLYSFFGFICYVKYGKETKQNVILNMSDNLFSKMVIGFYALGIIFFYPLATYVSYDMFWNNIIKHKLNKSCNRTVYDYLFRTFLAVSSVVLAWTVPNIALFVSVAGTVGTSLDSIIFPALAEMFVYTGEAKSAKSYWIYRKNSVIILFGFVLMITGVMDSFSTTAEFYNQS